MHETVLLLSDEAERSAVQEGEADIAASRVHDLEDVLADRRALARVDRLSQYFRRPPVPTTQVGE